MTSAPQIIRMHSRDNVVTACTELAVGTVLEDGNVTCRDPIPRAHKVATGAIAKGQAVRKFNQIIGFAAEDIAAGSHVHVHNIQVQDFKQDYQISIDTAEVQLTPVSKRPSFQGFIRADGSVGTRNYIGVLTSVNCSATVAEQIAGHFTKEHLQDYPNVDGVVALTHGTGCGIPARQSLGLDILQRTLAGYARHPNFAGVLIVGLGCEVNQIAPLLERFNLTETANLHSMTIQESGGTARAIGLGIEKVASMLESAHEIKRETVSVEHLRVGLQCGGSDAWSGVSANPSLGAAVDILIRHGGSAILSETPEIFGAENLLLRRAADGKVGDKLLARLKWWRDYANMHGVELNNNPSPGNIKGGLSTILEKSLGAVAKSGTMPLTAVYQYAEAVDTSGLVFMDAPGYDPCSVTGEIASGANLVCFTTGRGSVFGVKPVPCIKLASNTYLYLHMGDDMDINCGKVLDGEANIESMGEEIFQRILAVASGEHTASEKLGFGKNEFVPWQVGAVM